MSSEKIAIYGAGGFGKETRYLLDVINLSGIRFSFQGFLDDDTTKIKGHPPTGTCENVAVAVALPSAREAIVQRISKRFDFPNIVHPGVHLHNSNAIGQGCIICGGVQLTVDITIGNFVIINLNATIGHDVEIGDFTSIMPNVGVSGNVKVGKRVFIGTGAVILQGLTIGDDAVIGAGAVVTKNIPPGVVVKGVPGRY
jgi:sugar O-acyltransferase (sialic acid O-acetyltransferase NeuD family)